MNKIVKRIALLLIISIMILSIGSVAVYAAPNIAKAIQPMFDMLSSILNTQVNLPHPSWVGSSEKVSLWLLFAVFAIVFAPVYVVVKNKIPIFKDNKGPSVVFSIAVAATAIFGTGLVEMIGLVIGSGAAIAGLVIFLLLIGYGVLSIYRHSMAIGSGWKKAGVEHYKEVADVRKARTEIDRAGMLERKETAALTHVRNLASGVRGAGAALRSRLEHLRDELQHAQSLSSEQAMNIFRTEAKVVAGLISGQVPATYRTLTQINADEGLIETFDRTILQELNKAKQKFGDMENLATNSERRNPANKPRVDAFRTGNIDPLRARLNHIESLVSADPYRHEETKRDVASLKGLVQRFEGDMKALEADLMAPNPQAAMNRASALLHLMTEINAGITSVNVRLAHLATLHGNLTTEMNTLRTLSSSAVAASRRLP